jgi:hypothetical protein
VKLAAQPYVDIFKPVWKKHPKAILYPTANFDPKVYNRERRAWRGKVQCGHQRILAEAGVVNMVLFDTGVVPIGVYDKQGVPGPDSAFWWYGFWPDDVRYIQQVCKDLGTGASISVFEPGWMKNVVAMARAGTLPRGSKLNIYFAMDSFAGLAPPIPEALDLYLKMLEGVDVDWAIGYIGEKSVMDTPLARLALERGGSFRVGLEDWASGTSNVEQLKRAKEIIAAVGRPVVTGADAIKYLDIPFAATRPDASITKYRYAKGWPVVLSRRFWDVFLGLEGNIDIHDVIASHAATVEEVWIGDLAPTVYRRPDDLPTTRFPAGS